MSDKYHNNQIKSVLEHSKRIRILNRSILMLLLFGIIIIIYNYLNQDDDFVSVSIIDSKYEEAAIDTLDNILEIKNSVISGTDGDNQSYEITSNKTWNTIDNENILEMSGIKTTMVLKDNYSINITGDNATYDNKKKYLKLQDNVEIRTNNRTVAIIKNMFIDLKKNKIMSPSPILVKFNDICIRSKAFEIKDNGNKIMFNNGVNLIIGEKSKCIEI
jgi:LPS export ABC transporter protein LptC